jgi:hypothetical protein
MKTYPFAVLLLLFIVSMSSGAWGEGEGGPQSDPLDTPQDPFIITSLSGAKPYYWADPGHGYTVIYEDWQVYLFGEPGDNYTVKINGIEAFNGTLGGSWANLSFDASELTTATVKVTIGDNRTWTIPGLTIAHTEYTGGGGGGGGKVGEYFQADLDKQQRNGAIGATLLSIVVFIGAWFVVAWEHNRKGVSHE